MCGPAFNVQNGKEVPYAIYSATHDTPFAGAERAAAEFGIGGDKSSEFMPADRLPQS
jgi:hypothetical protein